MMRRKPEQLPTPKQILRAIIWHTAGVVTALLIGGALYSLYLIAGAA